MFRLALRNLLWVGKAPITSSQKGHTNNQKLQKTIAKHWLIIPTDLSASLWLPSWFWSMVSWGKFKSSFTPFSALSSPENYLPLRLEVHKSQTPDCRSFNRPVSPFLGVSWTPGSQSRWGWRGSSHCFQNKLLWPKATAMNQLLRILLYTQVTPCLSQFLSSRVYIWSQVHCIFLNSQVQQVQWGELWNFCCIVGVWSVGVPTHWCRYMNVTLGWAESKVKFLNHFTIDKNGTCPSGLLSSCWCCCCSRCCCCYCCHPCCWMTSLCGCSILHRTISFQTKLKQICSVLFALPQHTHWGLVMIAAWTTVQITIYGNYSQCGIKTKSWDSLSNCRSKQRILLLLHTTHKHAWWLLSHDCTCFETQKAQFFSRILKLSSQLIFPGSSAITFLGRLTFSGRGLEVWHCKQMLIVTVFSWQR